MTTRKCRVCKCTDAYGCDEGCYWVEWDLCSVCREKETGAVKAVRRWLKKWEEAARADARNPRPAIKAKNEAKREAIDWLRVLPKGVILDGVRYTAAPSRQEILMKRLPPKKGESK